MKVFRLAREKHATPLSGKGPPLNLITTQNLSSFSRRSTRRGRWFQHQSFTRRGRWLQHQSFTRRVETQCIASLQNANGSTSKNKFEPQSKNLASSIRGFKIGATKNVRFINPDFAWQSRYHDHIIRNDESYQRISEYIINNPLNWSSDQFYF